MKRAVRILGRILLSLLFIILGAGAFFLYLMHKDPGPDRPDSIDSGNGFVQAYGTNLYDGDGRILQLKGVNLGGWFIQ